MRARIGLASGAGSACTAPPAHSSSTSAAGLPSIRRSRCPAASVAVPRATNEEAVGWKNRLKVHEHLARVRARVRAWVRAWWGACVSSVVNRYTPSETEVLNVTSLVQWVVHRCH